MVAGVKIASQTPAVRSGQRIIFVSLDDATGPIEVTVFPSVQHKTARTVFHAYAMAVWGQLRRTGKEGISVIAEDVWDLLALQEARRDGRLREAMGHRASRWRGEHASASVARESRLGGLGWPRWRRGRRSRSCTSILTRSTPGSRCSRIRPCAASRSSSAAPARAAWSRAPPTRPGASACVRRCRPCARGACVPTRCSCRRTSRPTGCTPTGSARCCSPTHRSSSRSRSTRRSSTSAGATRLFGEPAAIAAKIRADVEREVGVTCSAGVAATKFVAKLASDHCKPDGLLHVPRGRDAAFLEPLPVGRLWGVGEKTAELLGALGHPHRRRPRAHTALGARAAARGGIGAST